MDITCKICSVVLGVGDSSLDGFTCESCLYRKLDGVHWIEFDKNIQDHKLKSPIPDFLVYMTEPFRDVHEFSDDPVSVSLCDPEGNPSSGIIMGNTNKNLEKGEVVFSGLYVGKRGRFTLKLSSPGHTDVLSNEFEVG